MKKIRLTESELVGLIKRIIKEDEESSNIFIGTKFCQVKTFEKLLKEAKERQKLNFFPLRGYFVEQIIKGPKSMIMGREITPGMPLRLSDPIKLQEGAEIFLKDITDFGQPQLECTAGKPILNISYGG